MRLLHVRDLTFKQFGKDPPSYAILSHVWSPDEELTYADILRLQNVGDIDGSKVHGFSQYVQAHFPQLDWIWVDSCCIRQEWSTELSEGVNSMFEWYKMAHVCIAYLSDVCDATREAFKSSIWHTRGWTLQEMLAANVVIFVDNKWQAIGHKGRPQGILEPGPNLETDISERTGIPLDVLEDLTNSDRLSTKQKLQWMMGRTTTREEDIYYALYGIFGVTPGANYGEKKLGAERRLLTAIRDKERLKYDDVEDQKIFQDILAWIDCPDAWHDQHAARQLCVTETGQWLLQSEIYKKWLSGAVQHIWIRGKAGCGKTILCSTIVKDVAAHCKEHDDAALGIFYFARSNINKQSYDDLLRALIKQLAWREPAIALLREQCGRPDRKMLSTDDLEEIVMAACQSFSRTFLILDAIGENNGDIRIRHRLLRHLESLTSRTSIRLLVLSRYAGDVRSTMRHLQAQEISFSPSGIADDISAYVAHHLTYPNFRKLTSTDKQRIQGEVVKRADGSFRWVASLLDDLSALKKHSAMAIEETLTRVPISLGEVYARELHAVQEENQHDVKVLLQWLTYAYEPLTIGQLLEALVISPAQQRVQVADRGTYEDIFSLLSGFIDVIEDHQDIGETTKVLLSHPSVQAYLVSERIMECDLNQFVLDHQPAHHLLEQSCFTYMLHCSATKHEHALLQYALKWWYRHTRAITADRSKLGPINGHSTVKLLQEIADFRNDRGVKCGNALEAASSKGHVEVIRLLLSLGVNADVQGGYYGRPLIAASELGHDDAVETLLDMGADVNAKGNHFGYAIIMAAVNGRDDTVKLLILRGAEVSLSGRYGAALQLASGYRWFDPCKTLLSAGADPNQKSGFHGNPLQAASEAGALDIVKLLLASGADVNAHGGHYGGALQAAAHKGFVECADVLIQAGADVNAIGGRYGSALRAAAAADQRSVAERLLARGARIDLTCPETALQAAAAGGHTQMLRSLIARGADINLGGGSYGNPLQHASAKGQTQAVKILLTNQALVNQRGGSHVYALLAAVSNGHLETARLLLDAGANVDAASDEEGTALEIASAASDADMVELLLSKPANVKIENCLGRALQEASARGHSGIVAMLLNKGANIDARDEDQHNALSAAVVRGRLETVRMLLSRGADPSDADDIGFNALHIAAQYGHDELVRVLLAAGAKADICTKDGWCALTIACSCGKLEVVKTLLDKGGDVHIRTLAGLSPILAAASQGHGDIVRILCTHGANIEDRGQSGMSSLSWAAAYDRTHIVTLLLELGADKNAADHHGRTPVFLATVEGHTETVRTLLKAGADFETPQANGNAPLHAAAMHGHSSVLQLLLASYRIKYDQENKGYDTISHDLIKEVSKKSRGYVDSLGSHGWTPLQMAVSYRQLDTVKLLISARANVDMRHVDGSTPLMDASHQGLLEIVRALLDAGAQVDAGPPSGARGGVGVRATHRAAKEGHSEIFKLLLSAGADINAGDDWGRTPVSLAAGKGHLKIIEILVDAGANIETPDRAGTTPVIHAALAGHTETVKLLIARGARTTVSGHHVGNAVSAAISGGHLEMLPLLFRHGGTITIPSYDRLGRSLVHTSAMQGAVPGVQYALNVGLHVNSQDYGGWTALHWAAYFGKAGAVEFLIGQGANHDLVDWKGRRAVQLARLVQSDEVVMLLRSLTYTEPIKLVGGRKIYGSCSFCERDLFSEQYHCEICAPGCDACLRCIHDVDAMHPGHTFSDSFRYSLDKPLTKSREDAENEALSVEWIGAPV